MHPLFWHFSDNASILHPNLRKHQLHANTNSISLFQSVKQTGHRQLKSRSSYVFMLNYYAKNSRAELAAASQARYNLNFNNFLFRGDSNSPDLKDRKWSSKWLELCMLHTIRTVSVAAPSDFTLSRSRPRDHAIIRLELHATLFKAKNTVWQHDVTIIVTISRKHLASLLSNFPQDFIVIKIRFSENAFLRRF